MAYMKTQRGLSTLEILFGLFIVGVLTALVLRFGPVYIEYYNVHASLQALQADMVKDDSGNAKGLLLKKLLINDVRNVDHNQIKVERHGRNRLVKVEYEVRRSLVGNIDVVIHFTDSVELQGQ